MFVSFQKLRNMRALASAIVPMAISFSLLVSYNEWRYLKLLTSYGGAFTTPLWTGLHVIFSVRERVSSSSIL